MWNAGISARRRYRTLPVRDSVRVRSRAMLREQKQQGTFTRLQAADEQTRSPSTSRRVSNR
jgi:hypothetical protein